MKPKLTLGVSILIALVLVAFGLVYGNVSGYADERAHVTALLEGDDDIAMNREIMGATDPKKAAPGTLRAEFAESITRNAVHGSDAPETAAVEIAFFFGQDGLCPRTL